MGQIHGQPAQGAKAAGCTYHNTSNSETPPPAGLGCVSEPATGHEQAVDMWTSGEGRPGILRNLKFPSHMATHSPAHSVRTRSANAAPGDTVASARQRNSPLSSELKSSNLSRRLQASRMACVISCDRHPAHSVHRCKQSLSEVDQTHDRPLVSTIMTKTRCARRQCATILLKVKFSKSRKRIARNFRVRFVHNVISGLA